jgi:hypothetical protein
MNLKNYTYTAFRHIITGQNAKYISYSNEDYQRAKRYLDEYANRSMNRDHVAKELCLSRWAVEHMEKLYRQHKEGYT